MSLILLAEDDPEVADLVRLVLQEYGFIVGVVESGQDAIAAARLKKPALILLDITLNGMNGLEALHRIRTDPILYSTPVLMLTARRGHRDVEIALRQGANGYIKKPFDPHHLAFQIEDVLAKTQGSTKKAA
jgi:CheY-like chemotaxis protein